MPTLERFVILMHDKTNSLSHVKEARVDLFAQRIIPPTLGSLTEHVKREVYQAGHYWSRS